MLPVVAIGASAGGLKQIAALLGALPEQTGAAFVVLQHLSSERVSQLPELLARSTSLPVVTIEHGMTLAADRVHVLPENSALGIDGDRLQLLPKNEDPSPTVIDRFLRALADARGASAVGIILSGSGHDGALGLKAIKQAGGLTLVQDPDEAEHDSMPRCATQSAAPDYVRPTLELIEPLCNHLLRNLAAPKSDNRSDAGTTDEVDEEALENALRILRSEGAGYSFSAYKPNMLKRRIQRRMGLTGARAADDYLRRLEENAQERRDLAQDFLISVTDFFRDPDAYGALREKALPQILEDREPNDTIRVWVPACATGEEAYSIAILLDEAIVKSGRDCGFTVFASDIDRRALEVARIGTYPESIAADVSQTHLRSYFDKIDSSYRVKRGLRERVVFASQNVIEDPPYSRLDLISCRNLLMYLDMGTQKQVIATFHFALKRRGLLFLGSSETVSGQVDLFEPLDKPARLFQRIGSQGAARVDLPFAPRTYRTHETGYPEHRSSAHTQAQAREQIARDILLREFVPAAVLVNRKLEILCSYGPASDFLSLPLGASSLSMLEMVNEEYRSHLHAITHRAFRDNTSCHVTAVPRDGDKHTVRISARPLRQPEAARGLVFVTFERQHQAMPAEPLTPESNTEQRLADELEATRNELNATIQALEASNEDLKGSNEEILSMNEELQSTNEELETSKEELQSVNEELTTVNTELEHKVGELETAHNDLQNLFSGTNVATLFLDKALCIKRFTPAIKDLLSLINSDIGRPLRDISLKFEDHDLETEADRVMSDLVQSDKEVRANDGSWYLRRILPYRTQENRIDGVVITFADISEIKQAAMRSAESETRLDLAMGAINGGMWDMRLTGNSDSTRADRVYLSPRLKQLLGFEADQFPDSIDAWAERVVAADRDAFRDMQKRRDSGSAGLQYRVHHRDGSVRWFASYGMLVTDPEDDNERWIGIDRDITAQKLTDVETRKAQARLQLLADAVPEMVGYIDRDLTFQFVNQAFNRGFDYSSGEVAGRTVAQIFSETAYAQIEPCLEAALSGHSGNCHIEHQDAQFRLLRKFAVNHVPHVVGDQTVGLYILITEIEAEGRRAGDRIDNQTGFVYLQRIATVGEMTSTLAHDLKQPLSAINSYAGALKRMIHNGSDAEETTPILGKIADQVEHASDMVNLTRDFVGKRDRSDGPIDLNTLVHQAVALTEGLARKHQVDIHLDLHTPLPAVQGTAIQIEQVIINLMINGIDAMARLSDDRKRNLTLRTRHRGEKTLEISVIDTGEGIPDEKLARIFDAFYTSKLEGTGLGLSLSKSIVEAHGGTMRVESERGVGASFFVRLPVPAQEDADA